MKSPIRWLTGIREYFRFTMTARKNRPNVSPVSFSKTPVRFGKALESRISSHFRDALNHKVVVTSKNQTLEGYFKAFSGGHYIFYGSDGIKVAELKKDKFGWALVGIWDDDEEKRKFIMPLILYLETKLFN